MAAARQALIKRIYEDPRNGFGSIADTLRQARQQDPAITRSDVVQFMETVKTREDRPQRGYNSFVPTEPMHQLQVDLADMSVFSAKPYRYMLVAIDVLHKEGRSRASGLQNGASCSRGVESNRQSARCSLLRLLRRRFRIQKRVQAKAGLLRCGQSRESRPRLLRGACDQNSQRSATAEDLSGASGSEQVAPATPRRSGAVQQQNSRRHGSRSRPSLLGSHESRTCQASYAGAGQEKRSPSAVPGSG